MQIGQVSPAQRGPGIVLLGMDPAAGGGKRGRGTASPGRQTFAWQRHHVIGGDVEHSADRKADRPPGTSDAGGALCR